MEASSYGALITALKDAEEDMVKGFAGNKAAATRARKNLMQAVKNAQEVRKELLAAGKGELRSVQTFFTETE